MKEITIKELTEILKEKNVKPSLQRLKILEFLFRTNNHPTVDEIYSALIKDIPTLSKTTVYNTLNLFIESELVKLVNIENTESRYDAIPEEHGHFKCRKCGKIYDFHFDMNMIDSQIPPGFIVSEKDVFFKGICRECLNNNI